MEYSKSFSAVEPPLSSEDTADADGFSSLSKADVENGTARQIAAERTHIMVSEIINA